MGNLKPFKKGNDPRRNLKGAPKMPDLKEAIADVIGEDGVRAILKGVQARAKKGDVKAADLLLDRFYGKLKTEMDLNIPSEIVINLKKGAKG